MTGAMNMSRDLRTFSIHSDGKLLTHRWKVEVDELYRGGVVLTATKSRDAFALIDQRQGFSKLIGAAETTKGESIWNASPIWVFVRGLVWDDAIMLELTNGDPQ